MLVILGGIFTAIFIAASVFCWLRFKKAAKLDGKWTFTKKTFLGFVIVGVAMSALMALIVAANISSAINARQGLLGTVSAIGTPVPGTARAALHQSFAMWLQSGNAQLPPAVQGAINERLQWQAPKAIICALLLLILTGASIYIWRGLMRRSKNLQARRSIAQKALIILGSTTVLTCLLLVVMVIANTQAALAPIVLTMVFS